MAYVDKVKEEIGWLKVVFAILLAADISLVAWGIQNYGKASPLLLTIGVIAAFLVTSTIIWIIVKSEDKFTVRPVVGAG